MLYSIHINGLSSVPKPNIDAITRAHVNLSYQNGSLVGEAIVPDACLVQDIEFTLANGIPAENTASRLETYHPRNPSQEELLRRTRFLENIRGRFMGLFAIGEAGVGKSHVAIGLAKALKANGQPARYVHVPSSGLFLGDDPRPDETLIIDDLNNPFGWGRQNFARIITGMHHNGSGRLFITSNVAMDAYPKFIMNMVGATTPNDPELLRIQDRAGTALRGVQVNGESYRRAQGQDPWADYSNLGSPELER